MNRILIKSLIASTLLMLIPGYVIEGEAFMAAIMTIGIIVVIAIK